MSVEKPQDWIEYYKQKGQQAEDLKSLSGYNHPLAQLTEEGFPQLIEQVLTYLEIKPEDKLLDFGCGAALITRELAFASNNIVGIDANYQMIRHAPVSIKRVLGVGDSLPFRDDSFDKILCHSVFQYFPNLNYAENVISEMLRVLPENGAFIIMDIPDMAKKQQYLAVKGEETTGLMRLFYEKSWFANLIPNAKIFDHSLTGYENSKYRFNVLFRQ